VSFFRKDMKDDSPPAAESDSDSARRTRTSRLRLAIGVVLGVLVLVIAADIVTASPKLCGSCHELRPKVAAWNASAHADVGCVTCHVAPYPWYARPQALIVRGGLIGRDVYKHVTKQYEDPVRSRVEGAAPMADEVCLQCHDPNRQATSGFRILINHVEHAKRNGSCISCHVNTAHPEPTRGTAISLMGQCYECHGTPEYPEASTDCRLCHPSDYELRPASHKEATWNSEHGGIAIADRRQCSLCHVDSSFCTDCHGLEMPHPEDWARGRSGHAGVAEQNRALCATCHDEKPDLCSMCHHKAYDPSKGDWVKQHFIEVRNKGAAFCFDCHSPVFCAECHVRS